MKKIFSVIIALLLIVLPFGSAFATEIIDADDLNEKNCVVDSADVISQETEDYLSSLNYELYEKTGASIVIATVEFTGRLSMEEYAYEAFNSWGIGDKNKDNGLFLLMSIGDDDYYALQGSGIEKDLTAGEISDMLWYNMEDDFAAKDYDKAARSFYIAAYEWFADFYDVELSGIVPAPGTDSPSYVDDNEKGTFVDTFITIIIWIVIILLVLIIFVSITGMFSSTPVRRYNQKRVYRTGPHTSNYRRYNRDNDYRGSSSGGSSRLSGGFGGGSTRGGGAGRRSSSSSSRSSSSRSSSSRSGSRSGGFGGGSSRGGGAGRRR